jgi:hypothetical protein
VHLVALPFDRKPPAGIEEVVISPTREVAMRPLEAFVRELTREERAGLRAICAGPGTSQSERAMIPLAEASRMSAPEIAALVRTDTSHVRKVIHEFNDRGFDSLDPDCRGARPPKTTRAERDRIVAVARARELVGRGRKAAVVATVDLRVLRR